ncbi:choline dehydrogenase-like flavoprotein [Xanthomonas arboricola]|nr:choline dehydrogenase-like flavoprotein [Xanthomonas arboricola]
MVVLEAGAAFSPASHLPDELTTGIYWMEERLSGGQTPTAFGANNSGSGLGGSTLHWGAFCPRPDKRDLSLSTHTGQRSMDWPIAHEELLSYIRRVEEFIGVSGPAHYPWDPERSYAYAPPQRNASANAMERGCRTLGITATDAPAALVTRAHAQPHYGMRAACNNCGACHQGCSNGAKVSVDTTWLPLARAHGASCDPAAGSSISSAMRVAWSARWSINRTDANCASGAQACSCAQAAWKHRACCSTWGWPTPAVRSGAISWHMWPPRCGGSSMRTCA